MSDSLVAQLLQQSIDQNEPLGDQVTGALIVRLLQRGIEQNERILEENAALKAAITSHITDEDSLVRGLANAFPKKPDGSPDYEGHASYHTTLIAESRERTLFLRGLRYRLIENGFWGLLAVLGVLVAYWWTGQIRGGR